MRDKHIHNSADSALLQLIYKTVDEQLVIDARKATVLITIKFIVFASPVVFLYSLLYRLHSPLLFILCFVFFGLSSLLFTFNFAHDFSHNTIFKRRAWNSVGLTLMYTMVGADAAAWKSRHISEHHYAPNVAGNDPDMQITNLIRVTPGSDYRPHHRFQHLYAPFTYMSYSLYWIFIKDIIVLRATAHTARYHFTFWLQKTCYLVYLFLLPVVFCSQRWQVVLAGFICMHLVQSVFLLFTFLITHHVEATHYPAKNGQGSINCSWLANQVKSSNDFFPFSTLANFIFGGFNNHIAHHLFPHIHHIHYPHISRILYPLLSTHNIAPNATTYWGGIRSHLRLLRAMGNRAVVTLP